MQKYNPFRPDKAVTPGMFSGRLGEIVSMERGLFQTKNGNPQHFLIEGERGIGKSSLLLYIDWVARGIISVKDIKFNFIVLNLELRLGMESDEVIDSILTTLKRELNERAPVKELCKTAWNFLSSFTVAGVSYTKRKNEISPAKLDELVDTLVNVLRDAEGLIDGILILIDEADRPGNNAKLGELCKLVTERLTRRGYERVSIILAGLQGLSTIIRESHESALRVFTVLPLEPLEIEERKGAIQSGLNVANEKNAEQTSITESACDLLANWSEGYPHFLQEFSYWAFEKSTESLIDIDDVQKGAFSENGAIDQLGQKYYTDMYIDRIGSEDYRKVLVCMAEFLDDWVERQHLIEKSGVKASIVDNALRALKDRRIIVANPAKNGQYRLPTRAFATWIKVREGGLEDITNRYKQQIILS